MEENIQKLIEKYEEKISKMNSSLYILNKMLADSEYDSSIDVEDLELEMEDCEYDIRMLNKFLTDLKTL